MMTRAPREVECGQYGAEHDLDPVGAGDFSHRGKVVFGVFKGHWASVAGDVVNARQNDYNLWLQIDDILMKAENHLRRGLAADAAIDIRLTRERLVEVPAFGNRVAHEDDAILSRGRRAKLGVGFFKAG